MAQHRPPSIRAPLSEDNASECGPNSQRKGAPIQYKSSVDFKNGSHGVYFETAGESPLKCGINDSIVLAITPVPTPGLITDVMVHMKVYNPTCAWVRPTKNRKAEIISVQNSIDNIKDAAKEEPRTEYKNGQYYRIEYIGGTKYYVQDVATSPIPDEPDHKHTTMFSESCSDGSRTLAEWVERRSNAGQRLAASVMHTSSQTGNQEEEIVTKGKGTLKDKLKKASQKKKKKEKVQKAKPGEEAVEDKLKKANMEKKEKAQSAKPGAQAVETHDAKCPRCQARESAELFGESDEETQTE